MINFSRLFQSMILIQVLTCPILMNAHAEIGPTNPSTFGQDIDSFIHESMIRYHIPGAVFVFIKQGRVFFKKGYGYANLESRTPVDSDKTVFRVGSNSKLFIATAAMKLVEQGKLNLDEDINSYLETFNVPSIPDKPITMRHLLTHTAGFDEINLNMSTLTKEDRLGLGEYLKNATPYLFTESGQVTSYSNYGMNLAAFIIESISGVPFHQYVDENILKPLQMKRSGFMPKAKLIKNMATPYLYRHKRYEILPHDYLHGYPCGSFMSSGSDMSRFIMAHLRKGELDGVRILKKSSVEFMHRRQFANHPALPGMALGFIEDRINGYRLLRHSGWVAGFKTMSVLIPDLQAGMFISYNIEYPAPRGRKNALIWKITKHILDRYYPASGQFPDKAQAFSGIPKNIEGHYRMNKLSRKLLTKIRHFGNDLQVRVLDDHTILVGKDKFIQKGPLLFEKADASTRIGFRADEIGTITHLFRGSAAYAYDRLTFFETSFFHQLLLGVSGVIFLSAIALTPVMVFRHRKKAGMVFDMTIAAWWLTGSVSLLNLVSFGLLVWALSSAIYISFFWALPKGLELILVLPIIAAVITLILAGLTIKRWAGKDGSPYDRIFISVVILGCLMFTYFLTYWNLLGFHSGNV